MTFNQNNNNGGDVNNSIESAFKCPHCGEVFLLAALVKGLVPTHDYPRPCRAVCPGSKQHPRLLADNQPLWKDEK